MADEQWQGQPGGMSLADLLQGKSGNDGPDEEYMVKPGQYGVPSPFQPGDFNSQFPQPPRVLGRLPEYPSFMDTMRDMGDRWSQNQPPLVGPDHQGRTPTYDPLNGGIPRVGEQPPSRFSGGQVMPPYGLDRSVPGVDILTPPPMPGMRRPYR